jgi:hypothetical protein
MVRYDPLMPAEARSDDDHDPQQDGRGARGRPTSRLRRRFGDVAGFLRFVRRRRSLLLALLVAALLLLALVLYLVSAAAAAPYVYPLF